MRTSSSGDTSRSHKTPDAADDDMDVNFKVLCDEVTRKFIEFHVLGSTYFVFWMFHLHMIQVLFAYSIPTTYEPFSFFILS